MKNPFSLRTIVSKASASVKEKGSKFIAHAFPVMNEADVKIHLEQVSKLHPSASHYCYAYRIGSKGEYIRAFDDGEPKHSAGTPILGQIKSKNLTNTLIIVVRYFGGTKLGIGGLTAAYKDSAATVLKSVQVAEYVPMIVFQITYPYSETASINRLLNSYEGQVMNNHYAALCEITWKTPRTNCSEIIEILDSLSNMNESFSYKCISHDLASISNR